MRTLAAPDRVAPSWIPTVGAPFLSLASAGRDGCGNATKMPRAWITSPLLRRFRTASMKRQPSPAPRLTKTASAAPASTASRGPSGGYLSGIKAAAAASAAMSTFAATSQAIANAVPPGRSPIDIVDLLGTPSQAPGAKHHAQHQSPRTPCAASIHATTPISARKVVPEHDAAVRQRQEDRASKWAVRQKTLRAVLQPTASSAAPFFEAMGCNNGAIGIIRLPRNAAAQIYPSKGRRSGGTNCDFFICARDEESRTEWQVALQLELEGSSCLDALTAHNENRRALHLQQELEEAVRARDVLVRELAACEKELLQLKVAISVSNQREAEVTANNASLLQRLTKAEAEVRLSENQKFELRGRMAQVTATAETEHSRLAASECALREQNTAQLKRIAILEDRIESSQRQNADQAEALAKLSASEQLLQKTSDEKRDALRDLHARVDKCKSLERQLSMAKEEIAASEKEALAARAAAARALDEAAACRLKCNELDGVSWSQKEKLSKAQETLAPVRKKLDAAEQLMEKYERQLEDAHRVEGQLRTRVSQLERENKDLKMDVQSLGAEKQAIRLELLQANLENDKVPSRAADNMLQELPCVGFRVLGDTECYTPVTLVQNNALRNTVKSLEKDKAELIARDRHSRAGGAAGGGRRS